MGVWTFRNGWFWTGKTFTKNEICTIEVKNAPDKETILDEDDLILQGLVDANMVMFDVNGDSLDGISWEAMLIMGLVGGIDGGTYGYEAWARANRLWQLRPVATKSWINIFPLYGVYDPVPRTYVEQIDRQRLIDTYQNSQGKALGFKVNLGWMGEAVDKEWLAFVRGIADECQCPIMVLAAGASISLDEILEYLKSGDVLSGVYHCYQRTCIVDEAGQVNQKLIQAVKNGVLLDTNVTDKYFSNSVYQKAAKAGLLPNYISTGMGLKLYNVAPVYDLAYVVSHFIALGMSKDEAFYRATTAPAQLMGLELNGEENLLVLKAQKGAVTFGDNKFGLIENDKVTGDVVYRPDIFIKDKQLAFDLR